MVTKKDLKLLDKHTIIPTQPNSIEHDLFMEWVKWLQVNRPNHGFMYDGIVCKADWDLAPKHILLILKDYNEKGKREPLHILNLDSENDRKKIFNLRSHLRWNIGKPRKWRTWDNAARWVYGLLNSELGKYPPFAEADRQGDAKHRTVNLKKAAVVDVKKSPGKSSCDKARLKRYFKDNKESYSFLARQIALYGKLDVIICCGDGLFDIFKGITETVPLKSRMQPFISENGNYLITQEGTIVVNFIHPLLLQRGMNKEKAYNSLMGIVQSALTEISNTKLIYNDGIRL